LPSSRSARSVSARQQRDQLVDWRRAAPAASSDTLPWPAAPARGCWFSNLSWLDMFLIGAPRPRCIFLSRRECSGLASESAIWQARPPALFSAWPCQRQCPANRWPAHIQQGCSLFDFSEVTTGRGSGAHLVMAGLDEPVAMTLATRYSQWPYCLLRKAWQRAIPTAPPLSTTDDFSTDFAAS